MRKSEVSFESISVCNVTDTLTGHGIHSLSCSDTNDVIDVLQQQLRIPFDVKVTYSRPPHSAKVLISTAGNSIVAMTTDLP